MAFGNQNFSYVQIHQMAHWTLEMNGILSLIDLRNFTSFRILVSRFGIIGWCLEFGTTTLSEIDINYVCWVVLTDTFYYTRSSIATLSIGFSEETDAVDPPGNLNNTPVVRCLICTRNHPTGDHRGLCTWHRCRDN
ncbi:uncharacterized protein Bfra_000317 [Botrytis fragariae]|uniref:Uncharacterized protein n=1 Tax=Botrytis fragariae TaxID=1964551 RepID=A0A8H6B2Y9_9HELO|nr:uncharacterized protein Bfra_000317 [Botrytis fragariae]KAF5878150.1 hypothetical protein Bfra_000317 [Botrytis fragariae]